MELKKQHIYHSSIYFVDNGQQVDEANIIANQKDFGNSKSYRTESHSIEKRHSEPSTNHNQEFF